MRGRDKLMEPVQGQPLLRRQAVRALGLGWPVTVALPPHPHPRYKALEGLDVTLQGIAEAREGMGATLRESFARLPEGTSAVMVLLADLPDLEPEDLSRIAAARDAHPQAAIWRGATAQGAPGHPILFGAETFPEFAALKGDAGGQTVVSAFRPRVHLVPLPGNRARQDLDTPEDWAQWRAQQQ